MTASGRRPWPSGAARPRVRRPRGIAGSVLRYAVLARWSRRSSSSRSSTRSSAASGRTASSAANPVGLPDPWVLDELHRRPRRRPASGGSSRNSAVVAGDLDGHRRRCSRRWRPSSSPGARSPAARSLYTLFTLGLLFPVAVAILPLFILVRDLGLLDNPLGLALPQAAFGLPLTIIILRPFFRSIPTELEDAAAIDGCGPFGFFWRILLPLSRPALATVAVLAIVVELEPVPAAAGGAVRRGATGRCRWA